MKNALFILHEYYPNNSAITNCLNSIIEEMIKQNIKVSVVTRRINFKYSKKEDINNVTVYRLNDYINLYLNKTKETYGLKKISLY